METTSLKALANKVLQRNSKRNFVETERKTTGNFELKNSPKVAYRIYSKILKTYLWVVDTDEDMHLLRSQGISEGIYTGDEIRKLRGLSKDSLREIHKVKQVFENSKIEEITTKETNNVR